MYRPIIPYNPRLVKLARKLRSKSTLSEIILWQHLKKGQVHGFDFHRQRPVDNYIVDFICCELWLVIELDGYSHLLEDQSENDRRREERLCDLGLKVIRFWDEEIIEDIDGVLQVIEHVVLEQKKRLRV